MSDVAQIDSAIRLQESAAITRSDVLKCPCALPVTLLPFVAAGVLLCTSGRAMSQTPSALQEWQYSPGWVLIRNLHLETPDWLVMTGIGAERTPLYDGASSDRTRVGPALEIRYQDLAFLSLGDGVGVNLLRGTHYLGGVSVGYDLGRHTADDPGRLRGLEDRARVPVLKLYYSYVVSAEFPMVLRIDLRKFVGGAGGTTSDLAAYLPLPGSSSSFFMFAGLTVTFADRVHLQRSFGVSDIEAVQSGYPEYQAEPGVESAGIGISACRIIGRHWIVNIEAAVDRLSGSARHSPITQQRQPHVVALSTVYSW